MTRDEHRAKCIEAIALAICMTEWFGEFAFDNSLGQVPSRIRINWTEIPDSGEVLADEDGGERYKKGKNDYRIDATAAFDALHGLARICPIAATEEMIMHANLSSNWSAEMIWKIMSAAGDLTNAPEKKT